VFRHSWGVAGRPLTYNPSQQLAYFVRTHEKALANALQLQRRGSQNVTSPVSATAMSPPAVPSTLSSTSSASTFAAALSLPYLSFTSQTVKPVKLTLTPHHLFYLLSRFEELGINVGPMTIRLESIHNDVAPGNYVSFLSAPKSRGRASDADSVRSSSSVRSVMSSMSSMWSHFNLGGQSNKEEKQKAVELEDLKYLYSAFTKIPCLRLSPDHRSKLIAGFEEFPFDTAVPLFAFKNVSALEICDLDFRQLFGWDRMAEQLRSLTVKRASIEDLADLTINIVLDDMDKRRRRSSKAPIPSSPAVMWPSANNSVRNAAELASASVPNSPMAEGRRSSIGSPQPSAVSMARTASSDGKKTPRLRQKSISPSRPASSRHNSAYGHGHHPRSNTPKFRRESGSSGSSIHSSTPRNSTSNLLALGIVPASKWRFLRHLSLAENGLTFITAHSLAPLAQTLHSFDLSSNLFSEIPESLASLTNLRALNLSNCMIDSMHSLLRNPLPAITTLNLRSNRLVSLAGIERLFSLERVDLRDNKLTDPTELARLTRMPDMQDIYVAKNPFVRTHPNYRITIFNLFRATPGYTEDIKIDSTGPSYSERRQLVDRAPEPPQAPVAPPLLEDERSDDALNMPDLGERSRNAVADHKQGLTRPVVDYSTASQRKKKGSRRRIVELSHEMGSEQSTQDAPPSPHTAPKALVSSEEQQRYVRATSSPPRLPPLDTGASSMSIEEFIPSAEEDENIGVNSEAYRQKIETLKSDLGNGWLTALSEDMKNGTEREYSARPSMGGQRTDSREVTVGGRRLG
jgi:Leucine-rich repeat (LRR) protein